MKKFAAILAAAAISVLSVANLASAETAANAAAEAATPVAVTETAAAEQTAPAAEQATTPTEQAAATEQTAVTEPTETVEETVLLEDANTMYVSAYNGRNVNLRSSRSTRTNRNIIASLKVGQAVTVLAQNGNWMMVRVNVNGFDRIGYIWKSYLAKASAADQKAFHDVTAFRVTVNPTNTRRGFVNLRASASVAATRIRKMHFGEKLTVLAENSDWYQVADNYGHLGYVAKAYVKA